MTDQAKKAMLDAAFQRVEAAILSSLGDSEAVVLAGIQQVLTQARERIDGNPEWLDEMLSATGRPTEA